MQGQICRLSIDLYGSGLNICPVSTLTQLNYDVGKIQQNCMNVRELDSPQRVTIVKAELSIQMGPCHDRRVPPRHNRRLRPQRGLRQSLSINHCIIGKIKIRKLQLFFDVQLHFTYIKIESIIVSHEYLIIRVQDLGHIHYIITICHIITITIKLLKYEK